MVTTSHATRQPLRMGQTEPSRRASLRRHRPSYCVAAARADEIVRAYGYASACFFFSFHATRHRSEQYTRRLV
jgi:hypothetical protein